MSRLRKTPYLPTDVRPSRLSICLGMENMESWLILPEDESPHSWSHNRLRNFEIRIL